MKRTWAIVLAVYLLVTSPIVCAYEEEEGWAEWAWNHKCTIIGAGVGMATAPITVPAAIAAAGFGTGGIVAGSLAAKMMSAAAVYGGTGGVAAGGVVATLQSAGAAGLGALTTAAATTTGAVVGSVVGSSSCTESSGKKCKEN